MGVLLFTTAACSSLDGLGRSIFGGSSETKDSATATADSESPGSTQALPSPSAELLDSGLTVGEPDISASQQVTAKSPALEVTWKIPDDPSPSYVIYYGRSPDSLVGRVEVATARLETIEDPKEGRLYRYLVPDVPADGELYVAITAFDGETESPRSNSLSVEAAP